MAAAKHKNCVQPSKPKFVDILQVNVGIVVLSDMELQQVIWTL